MQCVRLSLAHSKLKKSLDGIYLSEVRTAMYNNIIRDGHKPHLLVDTEKICTRSFDAGFLFAVGF